ncbi:MAG: PilZ domain-containing protein [Acidobacteriota bacterium]
MQSRERRTVQRIHFDRPLRATVANGKVGIVDLSISGARVQHDFALTSGKQMRLDFEWNSRRVILSCRVVRCRLEKSSEQQAVTYLSGLRFTDGEEIRSSPLRDLIAEQVSQDLLDSRRRKQWDSILIVNPAVA